MANRKLFLSWTAVRDALNEGKVTDDDLGVCLYCTSVGELILAHALEPVVFARTIEHLVRAAKEGRLAYYDKIEHLNDITVEAVNHMLSLNGERQLKCSRHGLLCDVLSRGTVPTVEGSALEVLWTGQLSGEQMQACRQRQHEDDLARIAKGEKPVRPSGDWMSEVKQALGLRG